ncbi:hypothetical protein GCM10027059_37590 [Myceligenerans halotolerans]
MGYENLPPSAYPPTFCTAAVAPGRRPATPGGRPVAADLMPSQMEHNERLEVRLIFPGWNAPGPAGGEEG